MQRRRAILFELGGKPPAAWLGLVATLAAVAAGTILVYPLKSVAPVVSLGVVYLPAILLISTIWGLRLGLLASVASAVAFNFFHIPPLHRFPIAEGQNWVALAAFAIVAAISSAVAGLARSRAVEAERRRVEADRALSELASLAAERDQMQAEMVEAEALRRSDELKTALVRSISHDLRTPLTAIIASGAALGSTRLTAVERAELSEAIVTDGEALSRLVENLLDMSRLEAGKAEPHRERIDLGEVLSSAYGAGGPAAGQIHFDIASNLPLVDADAAQLERAFANLLENAIRHGDGKPVFVTAAEGGGEVSIRVVDRGPGIPSAERDRIFEPFERGGTNGGGRGFGLGLAIAKGFVEANGGTIAVESRQGHGASFVVSLPVALEGSP
ncbi:MAG TPA: ATP-binding protein [Solirubrobacterales bacterium]|nr:ATP-binding protein [Solirubrobacterales bacterium]